MSRKARRLSHLARSKMGKAIGYVCTTGEKRFQTTSGCFALQRGHMRHSDWKEKLDSKKITWKSIIFWLIKELSSTLGRHFIVLYHYTEAASVSSDDNHTTLATIKAVKPKYLTHDSKYSTERKHAFLGSVQKVSQLAIKFKRRCLESKHNFNPWDHFDKPAQCKTILHFFVT